MSKNNHASQTNADAVLKYERMSKTAADNLTRLKTIRQSLSLNNGKESNAYFRE